MIKKKLTLITRTHCCILFCRAHRRQNMQENKSPHARSITRRSSVCIQTIYYCYIRKIRVHSSTRISIYGAGTAVDRGVVSRRDFDKSCIPNCVWIPIRTQHRHIILLLLYTLTGTYVRVVATNTRRIRSVGPRKYVLTPGKI